jgi:hypothetical protein
MNKEKEINYQKLSFYQLQTNSKRGVIMQQSKDFNELAKERYKEILREEEELKAKLEEIQKQKGPLKAYLQGAGLVEVRRRGPRKKKGVEKSE